MSLRTSLSQGHFFYTKSTALLTFYVKRCALFWSGLVSSHGYTTTAFPLHGLSTKWYTLKHNQRNPCHAFTFLFIRQVFFSFVYKVCHGTAVILSWDIRVGFDRSSQCFCYKNDPLPHHESGEPLTYVRPCRYMQETAGKFE